MRRRKRRLGMGVAFAVALACRRGHARANRRRAEGAGQDERRSPYGAPTAGRELHRAVHVQPSQHRRPDRVRQHARRVPRPQLRGQPDDERVLDDGLAARRPHGLPALGETAAYWMPTLYVDGNAVLQWPIYYRRKTLQKVTATPPGKMIAGDATAKAPQGRRVTFWNCGAQVNVPPSSLRRRARTRVARFCGCTSRSRLAGTGSASTARTTGSTCRTPMNGRCPAGYDVEIPQISLIYRYPVTGQHSFEAGLGRRLLGACGLLQQVESRRARALDAGVPQRPAPLWKQASEVAQEKGKEALRAVPGGGPLLSSPLRFPLGKCGLRPRVKASAGEPLPHGSGAAAEARTSARDSTDERVAQVRVVLHQPRRHRDRERNGERDCPTA